MNEKENQGSQTIEYKKMHIYKLLRSEEKDKGGRPTVFLHHLGEESTI